MVYVRRLDEESNVDELVNLCRKVGGEVIVDVKDGEKYVKCKINRPIMLSVQEEYIGDEVIHKLVFYDLNKHVKLGEGLFNVDSINVGVKTLVIFTGYSENIVTPRGLDIEVKGKDMRIIEK